MENNIKNYISPAVKIVCFKTSPLMSGSIYIQTAGKDYDGRAVLSREARFSWGDGDSEE